MHFVRRFLLWLVVALASVAAHAADVTINGLPSASALGSADGIPVWQGGTKQTTVAQIQSAVGLNYAINLQQLGACGISDGTNIFNAAKVLAVSSGRALYIPAGCTLNHSSTLTIVGLTLLGDGQASILNATDQTATNPALALVLGGSGTIVRGINFKTTNTTATRASATTSSAITATTGLANFSIDHNYFTSQFAATDIEIGFGVGASGDISANQVTVGPLSNPIILQSNSLGTPPNNVNIHDNIIDAGGVGDTCVELTYAVRYINVANNQFSNCGAYGVAVIGGVHINIVGNNIVNAASRAIAIDSDGASFTLTNISNVLVSGNTISGGGAAVGAAAAIFVAGDSLHTVQDVIITGNTVEVTAVGLEGIQIGACDTCSSADIRTQRVTVSHNYIVGDGVNAKDGIALRGVSDVQVIDNMMDNMQQSGIFVCCGNANQGKIAYNHVANVSLQTAATYPAYNLGNSGFAQLSVIGNTYTAGVNAVNHVFTCGGGTPLLFLNSSTDISGCSTFGQLFLPASQAGSAPALAFTGGSTGLNGNNTTLTFVAGGGGRGQVTSTSIWSFFGPITPNSVLVSALPTCNSGAKGQMELVTDASSPTYGGTLTGGSTTLTLALCNGTNWVAQ